MVAVSDVAPISRSTQPTDPGEGSRRRARLLTLIAIAVGAMVGSWACASGMTAGHAHHSGDAAAIVAADGHGHHDAARPDPAISHDAESSTSTSFMAMSCVVGVDLRVRDLAFATVCDAVSSTGPSRPVDHASEPEPPVPRFS